MSTLSNILLDKEILLESGTNELEVLVFQGGKLHLRINVAKVRECCPPPRSRPCRKHIRHTRRVQVAQSGDPLCFTGRPPRNHPQFRLERVDDDSDRLEPAADGLSWSTKSNESRLSWKNILAVPALDDLAGTPVTALATLR